MAQKRTDRGDAVLARIEKKIDTIAADSQTLKSSAKKTDATFKLFAKKTEGNTNSLIENDKLVLQEFGKLQDEMEALRNDVHEVKDTTTKISLRVYGTESDLATIKRLLKEEPGKLKVLESRVIRLEQSSVK